jgi:hypothetical protein
MRREKNDIPASARLRDHWHVLRIICAPLLVFGGNEPADFNPAHFPQPHLKVLLLVRTIGAGVFWQALTVNC